MDEKNVRLKTFPATPQDISQSTFGVDFSSSTSSSTQDSLSLGGDYH